MVVKTDSSFDIASYGNSLMDLLGHIDYEKLQSLMIQKGTAKMIDNIQAQRLLMDLKGVRWKKSPGGSTLNTVRISAQLGLKNYFAGAVGMDAHGSLLIEKLKSLNITQDIVRLNELPTGTCMSMVTPDAERTMAFDLGAAKLFSMNHVKSFEYVKQAKVFHWTAYKLLQPSMKEIIMHAMEVARKHKTLISFDFADAFLIQSFKDEVSDVSKLVDIAFLNENEANMFAGSPYSAIEVLKKTAALIVVKLGKEGCLVYDRRFDSTVKVGASAVKAIDTTGAGDSFAAGFLYGITHGFSAKHAGMIGNAVGASVVQHQGSVLLPKDLTQIRKTIEQCRIEMRKGG